MLDTDKSGQVPDRNAAHTNGWDAVFALHFDTANKALKAGWPTVNDAIKKIEIEQEGFKISGSYEPWQFTVGGDGKLVRFSCTFAAGSTYTAMGGKKFDLAPAGKAAEVTIELSMDWVPQPGQKFFVISNTAQVDTIKKDLDKDTVDATLKAAFTANHATLSNSATARVVTQGLEWHINDGAKSYFIFYNQDKENNKFLDIYQYEKIWAVELKALAKAVSKTQPAVTVITVANNPINDSIAADVFSGLLSKWFNDNIGNMDYAFAKLNLAPEVSKDEKYAWMKPTGTSYAVIGEGSMETSVFGALTMAQNHPIIPNHQVSAHAIPSGAGSNGADAGFLISGPDFVKYMLLPGAQTIFNNAPADSFEIINDHLTVQNTKKIVWGKFILDNKKEFSFSIGSYASELNAKQISQNLKFLFGEHEIDLSDYHVDVTTAGSQWLLTKGKDSSDEYILNLKGTEVEVYKATLLWVEKGGFKMSLVHSYVEIEFAGVKYDYSSDFDVHVTYTEQVVLGLKNKGGKQIFWFDQVFKNLVVSVTKTNTAITRAIVEGAVTGVLSLIALAGPILEGLSEGVEVADLSEEGGTGIVNSERFAQAEEDSPLLAERESEETSLTAEQMVKGKLTNIKTAFLTPKWKLAGTLAALAGAVTGIDATVTAVLEKAAKNKWEEIPGFDDFANQVIEPYSFPNVSGFELKSAWLADSLQIGLKTK